MGRDPVSALIFVCGAGQARGATPTKSSILLILPSSFFLLPSSFKSVTLEDKNKIS
jgi:hypothetical protein